MVEYVVFFPGIPHFVHESHLDVLIARIHFAPARIDRTEYRFDARGGLRHQTGRSGRGDRQHRNVAAAVFHHFFVKGRVRLFDAFDHRVALFAPGVVYREFTALLRHLDRCAVGFHCQRFLYFDGEIGRFVGSVAQAQGCQHIAFGRDAQARTASLKRFFADFLPQFHFHLADILVFGIFRDFFEDRFDLFEFEVDDIVHHPHGCGDVPPEFIEVERSLLRERLVDVAVQVDRQQAATVVRAQRNFAARVRRNGAESEVGVAVRHRFAQDGVPEQHARFGGLPCVEDDFVPQCARVDVFLVHRLVGIDRELLVVFFAVDYGVHEFVVDLDRNVRSGYFAGFDFGVDEVFCVRVFYRQRQHQRAAPSVLRHFARRVRISLHERHDPRRGQRAVQHRAAGGPDVRQVVPDASAAFHQLHLFFVDADDAAVRVGRMAVSDHKTVR